MATTNTKTVSLIVNRLTAMQAGFNKDFTAKQSLMVEGNAMVQPTILAQIATYLSVVTAVETTRTTLANQVAAKKAQMPAITKFLSDLETALKAQFGSGSPELQDFGIAPPKARKTTSVQDKAVAAANAKATKAARGIIGKTQRSKITTSGTPGVVVVDAAGNVVPGLSTGPIPPGAGEPVPVAAVSALASGSPSSAPSAPAPAVRTPAPVWTTPAPVGRAPTASGSSGQ